MKSPKEVKKQKESRVFLLFLHSDRWIRIREAKKHVDPGDPDSDPEHCLFQTDLCMYSDNKFLAMVLVPVYLFITLFCAKVLIQLRSVVDPDSIRS